MANEEFEKLESEMKEAFHRYNKGLPRLAKRARSRSKLYLHEPKALWGDLRRFWGWVK